MFELFIALVIIMAIVAVVIWKRNSFFIPPRSFIFSQLDEMTMTIRNHSIEKHFFPLAILLGRKTIFPFTMLRTIRGDVPISTWKGSAVAKFECVVRLWDLDIEIRTEGSLSQIESNIRIVIEDELSTILWEKLPTNQDLTDNVAFMMEFLQNRWPRKEILSIAVELEGKQSDVVTKENFRRIRAEELHALAAAELAENVNGSSPPENAPV